MSLILIVLVGDPWKLLAVSGQSFFSAAIHSRGLQLICGLFILASVFVGLCHHSMARSQVADGETASDMEGSCE